MDDFQGATPAYFPALPVLLENTTLRIDSELGTTEMQLRR
jgi:hypothetical protein